MRWDVSIAPRLSARRAEAAMNALDAGRVVELEPTRKRGEMMIDSETVKRYALRMTTLCDSFPTLREADGVNPWNVDRFESWLQSGAPGHGARCAGRFVLSVWNPYHDW